MKPILYIDFDGVLMGTYGGCVTQLRPNVMGFLTWCLEHFDCRWLTAVPHEKLEMLFRAVYAMPIYHKISYVDWHEFGEKDDAVVTLGEEFYWIEDGDVYPKVAGLTDINGYSRYIEVNAYGERELEVVQAELQKRLLDMQLNGASQ